MLKRAVINVSTAKYWVGQQRLSGSLLVNKGNYIQCFYQHEAEVAAPFHTDNMYAFKPYAMKHVADAGFTTLLWLDASMYVLNDITPIFEAIERDGYFFQDSGWMNERWTTAEVLGYFGTNKGRMISSGVLGVNILNPDGKEFLDSWFQACNDGMFNGSHDNYRHDQSAASLIIEQMGLKITDNNTFWTYGKATDTFGGNILIVADGIS